MRKLPVVVVGCVAALAGCGSSKHAVAPPQTTTATPTTTAAKTTPATATAASSGPSALQGEAASAATGDIPDNQVFLVFRDAKAGYSMKYPEGWAQQGSGPQVVIRDKNNIVRVVVSNGVAPTPAGARHDLAKGARLRSAPQTTTISGAPAVKVVYTTESAPNPVTGKRVTLVVDRYYLTHAGKEAIIDLGTPVGVDNVDAYRMMIQSFRWS
jgi:hypothetical protein